MINLAPYLHQKGAGVVFELKINFSKVCRAAARLLNITQSDSEAIQPAQKNGGSYMKDCCGGNYYHLLARCVLRQTTANYCLHANPAFAWHKNRGYEYLFRRF